MRHVLDYRGTATDNSSNEKVTVDHHLALTNLKGRLGAVSVDLCQNLWALCKDMSQLLVITPLCPLWRPWDIEAARQSDDPWRVCCRFTNAKYSCISGEIGHQILSTSPDCVVASRRLVVRLSFTVHLYRNSIQEGNWVCLTGATLRFRASQSAASVAGARSKDLRRPQLTDTAAVSAPKSCEINSVMTQIQDWTRSGQEPLGSASY